ncbi:MAG: nitronate monooxygenase [Luminiphilus sp.]|nr:nitronate monooxygenase [Luminiphilus sp.]
METRLTTLLGSQYPVIQTAMGWIADANLVAATGRAGGFGFLAGAVMSPAEVEAGVSAIRAQTDAPFGVNFHMYVPHAQQIVDICIAEQVGAVSYSRSPDAATIARFKAAGIVCIPTVGALKHAVKAVELGADALVVQGSEGGGHTGQVATSILLPQVRDAVAVPLAAAGGFRNGAGLVAALSLGADGIAMGTRFLLTRESPVPDHTKAQYLSAVPEQIIVSAALDGLPQRMVLNPQLKSLMSASSVVLLLTAIKNAFAFSKQTGDSPWALLKSGWRMYRAGDDSLATTLMSANAPMLIQEAVVHGRPETGILPSGQVAGLIDNLPAVSELMEQLMEEAGAAMARLNALRGVGTDSAGPGVSAATGDQSD